MMNFLLILSVFNRDTTVEDLIKCHPKIAIVYNNVSKNKDYNLALERIDIYKNLVLEDAVEFYCSLISDDTFIGSKSWKDLKKSVMTANYQEEAWFVDLPKYEKEMVKSLEFA